MRGRLFGVLFVLAGSGCGGGGDGGDLPCTVGAPIEWQGAVDLEGAATMGDRTGLWFRPYRSGSHLVVVGPDGAYDDVGDVIVTDIHPTGAAQRPALVTLDADDTDDTVNVFYLPVDPGSAELGTPLPLTETSSATKIRGVSWTGSETLVVVRDARTELFPGSGDSGRSFGLLRVDPDGLVTDLVELEDAPDPPSHPPRYSWVASTVVGAERDGNSFTLRQYAFTGGMPIATATVEVTDHHAWWLFGDDSRLILALLHDADIELISFDATLERGDSVSLPLGDGEIQRSTVEIARQAGGFTVAFSRPVVTESDHRSAEVVARHFDAELVVRELASQCGGSGGSNEPVTLLTPAHASAPTLVWRYPAAGWLGIATF